MTTRTCCTCKQSKPLEDFAFAKKSEGKRHPRCKICMCAATRNYYTRHRAERIQYAASAKKSRKEQLVNWIADLKHKPCIDCGNSYPPCCMDFDHRDPTTKLRAVSEMVVNRMCAREKILEEIAKCDLVCANCHRIRTHHRRTQ